jgi:membrane associated rhomboid family serine protease
VFLHFDLKHLVGNMGALLFLGPPLAAQIGHLRTIALFVLTGIAGNVVSHVFGSEAAVKAGASGGICGLLGALAGVAIARMAAASDARERRPAWQTLGALVALFGMIVGVAPGSDHYAHVGGVVAGVLLGRGFGVGESVPAHVAEEGSAA